MNTGVGKDSPIPLYYQLKTRILEAIAAGEYSPGQMLPSERELQESFGISRATVRQALTELVNEHVLERRQGIGTVVAPKRIAPQLLKLTSFSEDMRGRGHTAGARTLELALVPPPAAVRERLQLPPGELVWSVFRLRLADEEPVGIQLLYVPPWLGLSEHDLETMSSFYRLLETKCGVSVQRAHELLNARNATAREAKLLQVKSGSALINVERVSYDDRERPVEHVFFVYRADRYVYELTLYR
jgi:GntR family transcriptional regulator